MAVRFYGMHAMCSTLAVCKNSSSIPEGQSEGRFAIIVLKDSSIFSDVGPEHTIVKVNVIIFTFKHVIKQFKIA